MPISFLENIKLLKKAILARAFHGELGINNSTEESAVELLKQVIQQQPMNEPLCKAMGWRMLSMQKCDAREVKLVVHKIFTMISVIFP